MPSLRAPLPQDKRMHVVPPIWEKKDKKLRKAEFNLTQYYTNSTLNHSNSIDVDIVLTNETQDDTYLTLDTYLIDTSRDGIIEEFPVLSAETSVSTPHALLCQQSEAQKSATKLLRDKFRYPGKDPLPNEFQDKRNEIEKIESIL